MATRQDEQAGFSTERPRERAVIVGVNLPDAWLGGKGGLADLPELAQLADTAGADVVGRIEQTRPKPESATFVGSGKLAELKEMVVEREATLVIFDNDLSPAQGRNLEKHLEVNILDRTELILDIFAKHASTRQSRLQVELAQLQYLLPRLTRLWSHLERQAGGIGTRGPGETQLETDRRLLGRRIAQLRNELKEIESTRRTQTAGRDDVFKAALVGYTPKTDLQWDGVNQWPALSGTGPSPPRHIYIGMRNGAGSLRAGNWKLIQPAKGDPQLYQISVDPYEKTDLAKSQPEQVAKLQALLAAEKAKDNPALPEDLKNLPQ